MIMKSSTIPKADLDSRFSLTRQQGIIRRCPRRRSTTTYLMNRPKHAERLQTKTGMINTPAMHL